MSTKFDYSFEVPAPLGGWSTGDPYVMDDFTFDIDEDEAVDYILRSYTPDEIIEDFIAFVYDNDKLSDEEKDALSVFGGFDGTFESVDEMSDEDKIGLAGDIVLDMITKYDVYDDVLQDYFEQYAYDEWSGDQEFSIDIT